MGHTWIGSRPQQCGRFSFWTGHTHLWFGDNLNPTGNRQAYFGKTGSFQGSAADGTSLKIMANPGGNTSASGNFNEWGQVSVTCS